MLSVYYGALEHAPPTVKGGTAVVQVVKSPPEAELLVGLPLLELPCPDAVIVIPSTGPTVADAPPPALEHEP